MDNFIVSARKYRPATFISVVGQSHITSTLQNAITRGQLAHAYLFCGPRGVGKTTCARIFAKAINCMNPKDGEACNECESCKAFNEGRSFNIHELDAASNNSVDDIRNLTDQVRIPPQIGRYSIYIIDEVHMLSLSAFNAFLKTLEEPPAHAVFILATTEKHKIIPTILSRCQIYDFNRIRVEDSVVYLKYIASQEQVSYDEESLHIIAQKADGGMRDALSMFDKVVSFCGNNLTSPEVAETLNVLDYETYFKITQFITEGDYTSVLLLFDDILRRGFSAQIFIAGLNNHLRNLLMCKNPQTISLLELTGEVAKRYVKQAELCSVPLLFESINLLTTIDSTFKVATNQRLNVELGLMKLCGIGQKKNVVTPSESNSEDYTPVLPQAVAWSVTATSVVEIKPQQPQVKPPLSSLSQSSQPTKQETTTTSEPVDTTEVKQSVVRSKVTSLTGFSLKDIINGKSKTEKPEKTVEDSVVYSEPDKNVESSIERSCKILAQELLDERPRLATALSEVTICLNTVFFKVSNDTLKDEIERNMFELKKRIGEIGDIRCMIDFKIEITEDTSFLKPIKIEDKLKYLTDLNPELTVFRKALDFDIE